MTTFALILLILVFAVTSAVGVVTGSNSLITVPMMIQFGIDARVAVATNMFGLLFLSIGGTIPFLKQGVFDKKRLPVLIVLTLAGSALGAALVGWISDKTMPIIISVSMIAVTIFTLLNPGAGVQKKGNLSRLAIAATFVSTFLLGIYGGLYSGGYVTMLTALYVALFGMTFTEAVANTKIINVFSSLVASAIFAWQGLIDYRLGTILAVTMFVSAYAGAHVVTKLDDVWLKRIFLATVFVLAIKIIIDFTFK
jgi:uncharacterized membrane protein YfcA